MVRKWHLKKFDVTLEAMVEKLGYLISALTLRDYLQMTIHFLEQEGWGVSKSDLPVFD